MTCSVRQCETSGQRGRLASFHPYLNHAKANSDSVLLAPELKHIMLIMLDWADCQHVERSEDKLSGAWVFRGTRVPVRALFENLEAGATIDQFLEWFPGVALEQVIAVLSHAERSLVEV
jgi:uncharacterized protein (DUF433 family)